MAKKPQCDPTVPRVPCVIGGSTYYLCYDFNGLARAEELTGLNLLAGLTPENNAVRVRALFFSALLRHQPDMTLEMAGDLISQANSLRCGDQIGDAILKTYLASNPEPDESVKNVLPPD